MTDTIEDIIRRIVREELAKMFPYAEPLAPNAGGIMSLDDKWGANTAHLGMYDRNNFVAVNPAYPFYWGSQKVVDRAGSRVQHEAPPDAIGKLKSSKGIPL